MDTANTLDGGDSVFAALTYLRLVAISCTVNMPSNLPDLSTKLTSASQTQPYPTPHAHTPYSPDPSRYLTHFPIHPLSSPAPLHRLQIITRHQPRPPTLPRHLRLPPAVILKPRNRQDIPLREAEFLGDRSAVEV